MKNKKRIGLIFGGRSSEHQISIKSAISILEHIDRERYEVVQIGITPHGEWLVGDEVLEKFHQGLYSGQNSGSVSPDPSVGGLVLFDRTKSGVSQTILRQEQLDVIFPILHGPYGEDGTVQGLLELSGIPYVGSGVLGSSVAMDKIIQKQVCRSNGLPVVDFVWLNHGDWLHFDEDDQLPILIDQMGNMPREQILEMVFDRLGAPVFVKPANLGSSIGISRATNSDELREAIELAFQYDTSILFEKAVIDARELEVSIMGNFDPRASVIGQIASAAEFYDYAAKYVDSATRLTIPAPLSNITQQSMQLAGIKAFLAVRAMGLARIDFLMEKDSERFFVSEINTLPGFTEVSMFPKLWQASGIGYAQLIDELIRLALERHQQRSELSTTLQTNDE